MSRKQKLKARDKVTRKMSRDGLVERNAVTGEDILVSKRETEADLKGGKRSADTFLQLDKRSADTFSKKKKQKQRRIAEQSVRADNAANTGVQPQAVTVADTPKQADVLIVTQSETSEREDVRHEQPLNRNDVKPLDPRRVLQKTPPAKSKPPPVAGETPTVTEQTTPTHTEKTADAPQSSLKHEDSGKLQFERDDKPTPNGQRRQKPPQKYKPEIAEQSDNNTNPDRLPPTERTTDTTQSPETSDAPQSALRHDMSDKLHFEPQSTEVKPPGRKPGNPPKIKAVPNQAAAPVSDGTTAPATSPPLVAPKEDTTAEPPKPQNANETDASSDTPKHNDTGADSPLHSEKADVPLHADKADTPMKPDKPGKLKFSEEETPAGDGRPPSRSEVKQQIRYGKVQKQADKSVKKLDTAKSKLPSKKKLRSECVFNEETGKSKRKLYFESEVKSQGEHLKGALPLRPVKAVGNSALTFGHRKMFQVEHENVATEAAHKAETAAEGGVRAVLRHHKTAPYRKVAKLEHTVQKKSVKAAYQKALAENPKLKSNPFARAFQKRKIKKDYAKAAREAQKAANRAKKAGSAVSSATKAVAGVIKRHPIASVVVILILLLLFCLMSLIGAFGSAGTGGLGAILTASYLAEDVDIDNAEVAYTEWEVDLQEQIVNAESTHSGYDEYRYNVGDINHNPYELMAYLTVKYQNFTYAAIESDLRSVFGEQYSLTFTPTTETRYADPGDANEDGDYEPYEWKVLTVSLTARSFSDVVVSRLSGDEMAHYALLLQTKGSRQYVGNPFGTTNWLSYVTSYYGYRIHPISGVKDLHRGVDIGFAAGTQILSAQNGSVTFAGYSGDYGNVVIIENADGLVTKYAHCETLLVSQNQIVSMGDVIATVGSTGNSTGPHLHFEVLKNGIYLNPEFFADTGSFNLTPSFGYAGAPMGDGSYAALIAEAEKYAGMRYVWGGSSPSTSFDCSGLVCYVYRAAGVYDFGRITANDIYNRCDPVAENEVMPGDLIFFHSTYSTAKPISHIGIYVGYIDGVHPYMFHAGDPIGYTRIDTPYWQSHLYGFARIPD